MLRAFRNAFKIPDLRNKILFTMAMLAIYRLGCFIPSPGVDLVAMKKAVEGSALLKFLNIFSGQGLSRLAIFGLGIMPYITAAIIMELLVAVIPKIKEWHEEGDAGRRKITQLTRYMTLGLALMQSAGILVSMKDVGVAEGQPVLPNLSWGTGLLICLTLVAGMALLMWVGELITERGVGNGMSLLIFAGIIAVIPTDGWNMVKAMLNVHPAMIVILIAAILGLTAGVVYIEEGERRIPVRYAKQVRGRKMYSGGSTYIPVKVNVSGVIPIIFAASVIYFPMIIASYFPGMKGFADKFSQGSWLYFVVYTGLIIFFCYFYAAIVFDPFQISDNLKKYGGFIPGIRPGMATTNYVAKVLNRITLPGSIYLAAIALIPAMMFVFFGTGGEVPIGGAALLIIVGVALETMKQIESQLQMRHYEGFLGK